MDDPISFSEVKEMADKARAVQDSLDKQIALLKSLPPKPRMKSVDDYAAGRAGTEAEKGDVLARIWAAWQDSSPEMRLGQFLYNAVAAERDFTEERDKITVNFFYTEDYTLATIAERYAKMRTEGTP